MRQHLQAIVTVLSLVNPLICGAMFAQIEAGQDNATKLADATKAALVPFNQPGLVTIPLGFATLFVMSLLTRRNGAQDTDSGARA